MSDAEFPKHGSPADTPPLGPHEWPQEWVVATVVPEPPPDEERPPRTPRKPQVLLPLVLFLLTCWSTYYVGKVMFHSQGWMYATALMTILVCHEAGHFIQTRRYRVPASYPFFLPVPIPPIGTLGAVIGMSPDIPNRRALYDIGISGPLAGLVPTMICLVVGLHWSPRRRSRSRPARKGEFGEPLLLKLLAWYQFGAIPEGCTVITNPLLHAGWVGLLITSLNLFPIGQLDGGHVLYSLLRTRAHHIATLLLVGAAVCVVTIPVLRPWMLMVVLLTFMGPRHPPTRDDATAAGPMAGSARLAHAGVSAAGLHAGSLPGSLAVAGRIGRMNAATTSASIPQRLERGGDAAAEADERRAGAGVADLDDGHRAEQAAEIDHVAGLRARHGDQPGGGGLVVDHADGHLVGDDRGDRLGGRVAGDGDHVQPDRADAGHRFELLQHEVAPADGLGQRGVFADRDERPAQAADRAGGEQPALLHRVVEHGHGGRRARGADLVDAQRLEDLADAVADRRAWGPAKGRRCRTPRPARRPPRGRSARRPG